MTKVRVYIDGFNLYHAIATLQKPALKWLNHHVLAQSLLRTGETLDEVNFFTAVLTWNAEKQRRHMNYIEALTAYGVVVHQTNFKKAQKYCKDEERYCRFYEEKQTDVAIAVKMVSDALAGACDRAILVTADSDQIPTARFLKGLPGFKLTLIFPPGRGGEARDLGNVVSDRKELTPGLLGTCLLPRTVKDGAGRTVATMPAIYSNPPA
jgi:uncharacterized LabA/DUF88 family protein